MFTVMSPGSYRCELCNGLCYEDITKNAYHVRFSFLEHCLKVHMVPFTLLNEVLDMMELFCVASNSPITFDLDCPELQPHEPANEELS